MNQLISLLLTASVNFNCSETYINSLDRCDKYRVIMEEILEARPEFWKSRFKRAIRGEFFTQYNPLKYATKKDIKQIVEQAAEYGVILNGH